MIDCILSTGISGTGAPSMRLDEAQHRAHDLHRTEDPESAPGEDADRVIKIIGGL